MLRESLSSSPLYKVEPRLMYRICVWTKGIVKRLYAVYLLVLNKAKERPFKWINESTNCAGNEFLKAREYQSC